LAVPEAERFAATLAPFTARARDPKLTSNDASKLDVVQRMRASAGALERRHCALGELEELRRRAGLERCATTAATSTEVASTCT
jgi:hypothetical protein